MKTLYHGLFTGLILGTVAFGSARAQTDLTVVNSNDTPLNHALVTGGVPFKKGALKDASSLQILHKGKPIPAQFSVTAPWDDGSVRWALLHTQLAIPSKGTETLTVTRGDNPAPNTPVHIEENDKSITIHTGSLTILCRKDSPGLIHSVRAKGKELLTGEGQGPVLVTVDGKEIAASAPTEVSIEASGPMRAVVCFKGVFKGVHNDHIRYTARLYSYAEREHIKLHFWLENHGAEGQGKVKPEWFAFEAMRLDFGLGLGDTITAQCEGVTGTGEFKVLQTCQRGEDKPFYTDENLTYVITLDEETHKTGTKTDGLVGLQGDNGILNVGIRHFWQNYEKAIERNGNRLKLWLWPEEGQWPRTDAYTYFIQRLKGLRKEGKYLLPGSVHKGHELVLDFSGQATAKTATLLNGPLFPRAAASYYAETKAVPEFFVAEDVKTGHAFCDFKLRNAAGISERAVDPNRDDSLFAARNTEETFHTSKYHYDQSYAYGWMDFGDLSVYGVGQISLSPDWPLLTLFEYLRNGTPSALALARQMVHHRIDIDQYWSDRDPSGVNGLQMGSVWPSLHANGRSGGASPDGTYIAGAALWHMMTGEPKAREACLRSAEGLVRAWAPRGGWFEGAGWAINSLCAAYDLTGDKRWLDEAMKLFNKNIVPTWEKDGPHLHRPGKGQLHGQEYTQKDKGYCHIIGPLCNLHAHTDNANVFKLLKAGCDTPLSTDSFYDAPLFLAGLYAYVGRVTGEADYLKTAIEQFVLGFPESKTPPVFLPTNKDWAERSAMTIRAAALMAYGFQNEAGDEQHEHH